MGWGSPWKNWPLEWTKWDCLLSENGYKIGCQPVLFGSGSNTWNSTPFRLILSGVLLIYKYKDNGNLGISVIYNGWLSHVKAHDMSNHGDNWNLAFQLASLSLKLLCIYLPRISSFHTRTFRNRAKSITMTFPPAFTLRLFFIHVDNTRDVSNKTTYVTFFAGTSAEEMVKISSTEVDARHIGWIKFPLRKPEGINVIKVEFKGPDNR